MDQNKGFKSIALIIAIITGFVFLISFSAYYVKDSIATGSVCLIPVPLMIILLSSIGLFVGSTVFFLLFNRPKNETADIDKMGLLLEPKERQIFKILAKKAMTQADLARESNKTRVQIHRITNKLKERGIIINANGKLTISKKIINNEIQKTN